MLGTGVQSLVCFFQRPDVKVSMLGTFVEVLQESLSAKKKHFKLKTIVIFFVCIKNKE